MTGKLFGHFHDPLLRRPPANSDRGNSRRSAPEHPIVRTAQGASRCLVRRDRPAATQALSQASDPTLRSQELGAFRPYNPVLSALTGTCYWWGWVPTCGLTALFCSAAIQQWFLPGLPVEMIAIAIVSFFTAVNLCGIRWVTRLAIPVACASASLAFLSSLVPILSGDVDWKQAMTFTLTSPFPGWFGDLTSVMAGLYLIGFAAPAFEAAACHVGETIDPNRNVPRAMVASAAMAGIYFIVLPVVWLGVLGPEQLGKDLALVLGPTFAPLLGSFGKAAAIWFIMLNMFHGTMQPLAGAARTLSQLSEDGLLPRFLAWRSTTDCPWAATLLTATAAVIFLIIGDPIWLIAAANFTYLISVCMPNVAAWLLRRDLPDAARPYRAPRGMIVLGLVASVIWLLSAVLGFQQFGLPTVLFGLPLAYSGAALYVWRLIEDRLREGLPVMAHTLHTKLTGAMLFVLVLDGAGYFMGKLQHPPGGVKEAALGLDEAREKMHTARAELLVRHEQIAHLAHHDTLTDLPHRTALGVRLAETFDHAKANGRSFAVLTIDLDHFKEANDVFGHVVGDELLCAISRRLQAEARDAFITRIGGDEFMLILATGEQPAAAEALADRLLKAFTQDFEIRGQKIPIGLSIGAATYPKDAGDLVTLQANADAALYRAKTEGRHMVCFFHPEMDRRLRERYSLQHDLRSAIPHNELGLYYQPQATIEGDVFGFEALVRWQHRKNGLVPPSTFITLAEQNGLIVEIGEWTLRQACREAASWKKPLQISVNLSPVQFRYGEDLPNLVHSVLLESGLAAERLELEITEGVVINDSSRALSILRRLKTLGVKITMDDFGTGYSSLSSLQSFPFDKIKIDRTFVSGVDSNQQSAAIVRAVIGLSNALHMPVIAEGVETESERKFLMNEGCREIQGYLIGHPQPIASYSDLTSGVAAGGRLEYALVG
jgi:diguanylate cyclase (GGDEF)-like protein